jgi:hypothetical protein
MHVFLLTLFLLVQVLTSRGVQLVRDSKAPGSDATAARQVLTAPGPLKSAPVDVWQTPGENEDTEDDDDADQDDPVLMKLRVITPTPCACISLGSAHRPAVIPAEVALGTVQARGPPSA